MPETQSIIEHPTHEHRLANGLSVLIREDRSSPVVAIVTHVKAGYFNEPDRLVGISHVLEHMYFKGTARRAVGAIARETKAAGGYLNAGTIYDYTSYYTVLPSASLEMGLDIQSDALRHSQIDEDELRKELLVITQEARRKLDSPGAVAVETLYEEMFDVHRIRRWRIGTEEGLSRLSRSDVWEYYRQLYHPANIILVIAGDVDPAATLALVERYYGDMPAGETIGERSPEEPARHGFRLRQISGDIVQTHMEWGWRTPGSLHEDTPRLDLLAVILGQGRASRLFRNVRERGLVTGITAYNYTPTDVGVFGISAELLPRDAEQALAAVWSTVAELRQTPPGEAELQRARNILESRFLRRLETVEGQANVLAEWQALGDWRLAAAYLRQVLQATVAELHATAQSYLHLDAATALIYRPAEAPALGWDSSRTRTALNALPVPAAPPAEPVIPVTAAPRRAVPAPDSREDGVWLYRTAGFDLAIKPRGHAPLVSMEICFRGGTAHEQTPQAGITGLLARVSVKGTRRRGGAALAEATEALGGSIAPSVSADLFSWGLSLPSRHYAAGLSLLAEVVGEPGLMEEELERERKVALSDLEHLRDDMFRFPLRLFMQGAFPGHPYGFTIDELEAALRAADRPQVLAWHEQEVLSARPLVVLVGAIDPEEAAAVALAEVEGVFAGRGRDGARPPTWPATPTEVAVQRAKTQTALVLGFPGARRGTPEAYALQVLSSVVSGLGGRLFEELRGRRSLAYTVSAYPIARWLGGAFITYIATAPEREEEARAGLLAEIDRLIAEPVAADELLRAQRYTVGAWQIRSQMNGAHVSDLTNALLLGEGLHEIREYEDRIRAITPEAIQHAVTLFFDPQRLVTGVVRGSGGGR
jgi:zinc protease